MSTKQLPEGWKPTSDGARHEDGGQIWLDDDQVRLRCAGEMCWYSWPAAVLRALLDSTPPRDESYDVALARTLRTVAEHHLERAQYGGASWEFHARAQTACIGAAERLTSLAPTEAPRSEPTDQGRARALELLREANGCLDDGDNQAAAGECIRAAISALTGEPCAGS